jgi:hypothetical protein
MYLGWALDEHLRDDGIGKEGFGFSLKLIDIQEKVCSQ